MVKKFANLQKRKEANWKCDDSIHVRQKKIVKKCKKRKKRVTEVGSVDFIIFGSRIFCCLSYFLG